MKKRGGARGALHVAMRTELDERRNCTMERCSSYGPMIKASGEGAGRGEEGVLRGVRQSHHNLLLISREGVRPRDIQDRGAADVGVPLSVDIRIIKKATPFRTFSSPRKGTYGMPRLIYIDDDLDG